MDDITIAAAPKAGQAEVAARIEVHLLEALASDSMQSTNEPFVFTATDADGALVGGITGATSYDWLLVKLLWVDAGHRRTGLGSALLSRLERAAREVGCRNAWLDTSNPAARNFYLSSGYKDFGRLENAREDPLSSHRRWFMARSLVGPV